MESTQDLVTLNGQPLVRDLPVEDWDPHCFVCGRHTDHVAEHDDLTAVGLAEYREGDVRWTDAATPERLEAWGLVNLFLGLLFGWGWFYADLYPEAA